MQDTVIKPAAPPEEELSLKRYFIKTLLTGTIIILPLVILLLVLSLVFEFALELVHPISLLLSPGEAEPHWGIDILAMILLLCIIFALGLCVHYNWGKKYLSSFERHYLNKIPLYGTVRQTVRQFSELKDMPFKQVVLVDIFGTGVQMTGFVTERVNPKMCTVFVPTAPNPTNGNIYHVPIERITFLKVSPDAAMRSIVGMGNGSSVLFNTDSASLNEKKHPETIIKNLKENGVLD